MTRCLLVLVFLAYCCEYNNSSHKRFQIHMVLRKGVSMNHQNSWGRERWKVYYPLNNPLNYSALVWRAELLAIDASGFYYYDNSFFIRVYSGIISCPLETTIKMSSFFWSYNYGHIDTIIYNECSDTYLPITVAVLMELIKLLIATMKMNRLLKYLQIFPKYNKLWLISCPSETVSP